MKTNNIHDPYRNKQTTFNEFAKAEGVPKYSAYHFYRNHNNSLEGFRERKNYLRGRPLIFSYNGKPVTTSEAASIAGVSVSAIYRIRPEIKCKIGALIPVESIIRHLKSNPPKTKRVYLTDEGVSVTPAQFAKMKNVSCNTVTMYIRNHGGSLAGFDNRGHSRIRPKFFYHRRLRKSKTKAGWAEYFNVSVRHIKNYLKAHNGNIDNFGIKQQRTDCILIDFRGKKATFKQWAEKLNVNLARLQHFYYTHGHSLAGFNPDETRGRKSSNRKAA